MDRRVCAAQTVSVEPAIVLPGYLRGFSLSTGVVTLDTVTTVEEHRKFWER